MSTSDDDARELAAVMQRELLGLRADLATRDRDEVRDTLRRCDSVRCSYTCDRVDAALAARQERPVEPVTGKGEP